MKLLFTRFFCVKYFLLILLFSSVTVYAQKSIAKPAAGQLPSRPILNAADLKQISKIQDTLVVLSNAILLDSVDEKKKQACYSFIPALVRALKINNSFYYGFDSLNHISKVYAPDSTFRIFTWQLQQRNKFRYYGVIQMRSGVLKMFPLVDKSDTMETHPQQILSHNSWYGCLYYNILLHVINKKKHYTLFGYERADILAKRKILEVLSFDEKGNPVFGAPIFHFDYNDSSRLKMKDTLNRFFIEYKAKASPTMNYDKNLQLIVYDHLAPPSDKARDAYFTYVQDGTYEGFKWVSDHWQWMERVFTFSIDELDNPPIPAPLFGVPRKQPELPR